MSLGPMFKTHSADFQQEVWPAFLPNIRSIKHLWDVVEWSTCMQDLTTTNIWEQQKAIKTTGLNISAGAFCSLEESMPVAATYYKTFGTSVYTYCYFL